MAAKGTTRRCLAIPMLALLCCLCAAQAAFALDVAWLPGDQHPLAEGPPEQAEWMALEGQTLRQGDLPQGVWLRLKSHQAEHDTLLLKRGWWRDLRVFVADQQGWHIQALGFAHSNSGHLFSGRYIGARLPDHYQPGQPVYLWLRHDPHGAVRLDMVSAEQYLQGDIRYLRGIMLFFGILLALTLYHLFIWIWLRQAAFGYYVLYLGMVGVFFLAQEGLLYHWQWRGWDLIGTQLPNVAASWTVAFAGLFVRHFVELYRYAPRFDRYLLLWPSYALLGVGALSLLAGDSLLPILAQITSVAALALTPVVIAAGIFTWMRGNIAGAYVTAAWSLVVLAVSYRVLYGFGITPLNWITLYGTQAAVACEAVLLALGLAHRLSIIRNQRDQARARLATEHRLLMHRQILNELARGLSASRDAEQVCSLTLAAIEKAMGTRFAILLEQPQCRVLAQRGPQPEVLELPVNAHSLRALAEDNDWLLLSQSFDEQHSICLLVVAGKLALERELIAEFLELALPALSNIDYLQGIRHQAEHDNLTGLLARGSFLEQARSRVAGTGPDQSVCVAFMDLDHFKRINDRHGHAVGDEVLVETARRMRQCLRDEDLLARYGGEEFVALQRQVDEQSARQLGERLRRAVCEQPCQTRVGELSVSVSIGLAVGSGASLDALIEQADHALYQAKHQGRDQVCVAAG